MGTKETTGQVHPRFLVRALMEEAENRGAKCRQGVVNGVVLDGDKVTGVKVDDHDIPADQVLIAMGPWSDSARTWFPKANLPTISGMRAHSVVVEAASAPPQALFLPNQMGEIYPRPDGTVYICGEGDSDPLPSHPRDVSFVEAKCKSLAEKGGLVCPELKGAKVLKSQACYLPCSSNGYPLIGRLRGYEGAFIATGHSCWGIRDGPATGKCMAELMWRGRTDMVDLSAFAP